MVFRFLMRFLLSEKVVNKLADSYPIRRAAKWVVYFAHKANAIKGDSKLSLNEENSKILRRAIGSFINFWKNRVHSIKPFSNSAAKEQNQSSSFYSSDNLHKQENSASSVKKSGRLDDTPEERLKKFIEELKKRKQ